MDHWTQNQQKIIYLQSKSKTSNFSNLYTLGIRNVGENATETLYEKFGMIQSVAHNSIEVWENIDIGPIMAKQYSNSLNQKIIKNDY